MRLMIDTLYENRPATIRWEDAPAGSVSLRRVINGLFSDVGPGLSWVEQDARAQNFMQKDDQNMSFAALDARVRDELLTATHETSFLDFIPPGTAKVEYRLDCGGQTVYSGGKTVVRNTPPQISGNDQSLGKRYGTIWVAFTVTDAMPESTFTITYSLNNTVFATYKNLTAPYSGTISLTEAQVAALPLNSLATIKITATDSDGAAATRTFTFTRCQHPFDLADFYLLRDDVPILKLPRTFSLIDYTTVGEHRYSLRAVAKNGAFCDSNSVLLQTDMKNATLAPLSAPAQMFSLLVKKGLVPLHRSERRGEQKLLQFVGRQFFSAEERGNPSEVLTVSYTLRNREEYQALSALFLSGEPLWYRDPLGNAAAICITHFPAEFSGALTEITLEMTRLSAVQEVEYD